MNTTKNRQNETPNLIPHHFDVNLQDAIVEDNNDGNEENTKVYEAKIITPQPYGVFALCKIVELFQIN